MSRKQCLLLLLLVILLLGVIFHKQLATHLKIALFITEEFPQISVKPLGIVTTLPIHQKIELDSENGKIVGDLFLPAGPNKRPAVILSMGVKTSEKDKPLLYHFADTLARLGYVTFWPRLEVLDKGQSLPEEPETFVESFKYLKRLETVDPQRISYAGFSVGSSTALVAASDPEIAQQVRGLVFFGGQYDIFEYLLSLASKSYQVDGKRVNWNVSEDAINHAKSLLENKKSADVLKIFSTKDVSDIQVKFATASAREVADLKKYSPKEKINDFKTTIFILHDKSDAYVPYVESIKLSQVLSKEQVETYHISDLFEHVQPNRPINIGELAKLYGFLYKVFEFL